MMQKIKYLLAFLAGAGYASAWWSLPYVDWDTGWPAIPLAVIIFGGFGILVAVLNALVDHWND